MATKEYTIDTINQTVAFADNYVFEFCLQHASISIQMLGKKALKLLFGVSKHIDECNIITLYYNEKTNVDVSGSASERLRKIISAEKEFTIVLKFFTKIYTFQFAGWAPTSEVLELQTFEFRPNLPNFLSVVKKHYTNLPIDTKEYIVELQSHLTLVYDEPPNLAEFDIETSTRLMKLRKQMLENIFVEQRYCIGEFAIQVGQNASPNKQTKDFDVSIKSIAEYLRKLCEIAYENLPNDLERNEYIKKTTKYVEKLDRIAYWLFSIFCAAQGNNSWKDFCYKKERSLLFTKLKWMTIGKGQYREEIRKRLIIAMQNYLSEYANEDYKLVETEEFAKDSYDKDFLSHQYGGEIPKQLYLVPWTVAHNLLKERNFIVRAGKIALDASDYITSVVMKKIFDTTVDKKKFDQLVHFAQTEGTETLQRLLHLGNRIIQTHVAIKSSSPPKRKGMHVPDIEECAGGPKTPLCIKLMNEKMKKKKFLKNKERVLYSGFLLDTGHNKDTIHGYLLKNVGQAEFNRHFRDCANRSDSYLSSRELPTFTRPCSVYQKWQVSTNENQEQAGCPFVYMTDIKLQELLRINGTPEDKIKKILSRRESPQFACATYGGYDSGARKFFSPIGYWDAQFS